MRRLGRGTGGRDWGRSEREACTGDSVQEQRVTSGLSESKQTWREQGIEAEKEGT